MPRTTTRSSRSSTRGARRTSPARGRSTRTRRTAPRLSNRQVQEISAVLLILVGLIGLIAAASLSGSLLGGIRDWLFASFGRAWFVPVALAIGAGAYLLWPNAPRPRPLDLISGAVAVLALIGLFGMAGSSGGGLGGGVDQALVEVVSRPGAWVLLIAGLVIGLIVTLHFSPGALIQTVVRGGQAAYAERRRLEQFVAIPRSVAPARATAAKADSSTAPIGLAYSPLPSGPRSWETETEPVPEEGREPGTRRHPVRGAARRRRSGQEDHRPAERPVARACGLAPSHRSADPGQGGRRHRGA